MSSASTVSAAAMGRRAGEDWKRTGIPTPNPFKQDTQPDLAQAWRRAYFAASREGARRG